MIELTTLSQITCYSIIIAVFVFVFKTLGPAINMFLNNLNPFSSKKTINDLKKRITDLETEQLLLDLEIHELKSKIDKQKKSKR